jgi:predicted nucleic acid-binding protein
VIAPYAYVDTSALVKLVVVEPESRALEHHLAHRAGLLCSAVAATELSRACRRALSKKQLAQLDEVLGAVVLMDVTPAVLAKAAELAPRELRTLDAIHLATALSAGEPALDFVTYDTRLAKAAKAHGFSVHAP